MALHPDFPESPYAILDPALRWFLADEALRESSSEKLMPPLVPQLRKKVKEWREVESSRSRSRNRLPGAEIRRLNLASVRQTGFLVKTQGGVPRHWDGRLLFKIAAGARMVCIRAPAAIRADGLLSAQGGG